MELLNFIFRSVWTFFGFVVLLILAIEFVQAFLNFIVELVHGKQPIVNIPKEAKFISKEEEDLKKKFNASTSSKPAQQSGEKATVGVTMEVGDVMTRSAKTGKIKKR